MTDLALFDSSRALVDVLNEMDLEDQFQTVMSFAGDVSSSVRQVATIAAIHLARTLLEQRMHLRAMQLMVTYGLPEVVKRAYDECIEAHPDLDDRVRVMLDALYVSYLTGEFRQSPSIVALRLDQLEPLIEAPVLA